MVGTKLFLSFMALASLLYASQACSCLPLSLDQKVSNASNVFRGKVISASSYGDQILYYVQVIDSCKLTLKQNFVTVSTNNNSASCGVPDLVKDQEYSFFADDNFFIGLCSWDGMSDWKNVQEICSSDRNFSNVIQVESESQATPNIDAQNSGENVNIKVEDLILKAVPIDAQPILTATVMNSNGEQIITRATPVNGINAEFIMSDMKPLIQKAEFVQNVLPAESAERFMAKPAILKFEGNEQVVIEGRPAFAPGYNPDIGGMVRPLPFYPEPIPPYISMKEIEKDVCGLCDRIRMSSQNQHGQSPIIMPQPYPAQDQSISIQNPEFVIKPMPYPIDANQIPESFYIKPMKPEIVPIAPEIAVLPAFNENIVSSSEAQREIAPEVVGQDVPQAPILPHANECTCLMIYDPVCGAVNNGPKTTYGNACEAGCAGAEVIHKGECLQFYY